MSEIDFSNYLNNQKTNATTSPVVGLVSQTKKTAFYLAVIFVSFFSTILLFRAALFTSNLSVEETLPPGVPLEAPSLDKLPALKLGK
jgi:hypothetical protein